jgi:dTDP-4-dehydrorhamnose 3,5-epimerase
VQLRRSSRPSRAAETSKGSKRAPRFAPQDGWIPGCRKDAQTVRADWLPLQDAIDGVKVREVRHLTKRYGMLTELFRTDWKLDDGVVDQVFEVRLGPGEISAWHVHRVTRDRLFVTEGAVRIVLFDARTSSPTHGTVNEFRFGTDRPALLVVPPGVWHGVQNLKEFASRVVNLTDKAYSYEDPDHWRLPSDSPRIPFRFGADSLQGE